MRPSFSHATAEEVPHAKLPRAQVRSPTLPRAPSAEIHRRCAHRRSWFPLRPLPISPGERGYKELGAEARVTKAREILDQLERSIKRNSLISRSSMPVPSMATISCCHQLRPPSPATAREGAGATTAASGHLPMLRRACLAAACVVAVGATGAVDGSAMASMVPGPAHGAPHEAVLVRLQAAPGAAARWSDRRQCPPWRANSLENVVPENLPRPAPRRRFNGVTAADKAPAPAASPDAVAPFLALRSGSMGCFSL